MEPLAPQASPLTPLPFLSPQGEVLISPEPDTRQAPSEWPLVFGFHPSPLMLLPLQGCGGVRMPPGAKKRTPGKGDGPEQWGHAMLRGKVWALPSKRASWPACTWPQAPPATVRALTAPAGCPLSSLPYYGRSRQSAEGNPLRVSAEGEGGPFLAQGKGQREEHSQEHSLHTAFFCYTGKKYEMNQGLKGYGSTDVKVHKALY